MYKYSRFQSESLFLARVENQEARTIHVTYWRKVFRILINMVPVFDGIGRENFHLNPQVWDKNCLRRCCFLKSVDQSSSIYIICWYNPNISVMNCNSHVRRPRFSSHPVVRQALQSLGQSPLDLRSPEITRKTAGSAGSVNVIPSGNLLHNELERSTHFSWENPLFP